ncbi:unnamed protein product [Sphagnum compactum]
MGQGLQQMMQRSVGEIRGACARLIMMMRKKPEAGYPERPFYQQQVPSSIMKPLDHNRDNHNDDDNEATTNTIATDSPEPMTPLPKRELFLIWIIHSSQAFQTTMLFPMLVFMVEKYGATGNSGHAIGWHAGLLASLFPLAQCCTSMLWGVISDRTGRKPWLAFGCTVSMVCATLLGFCSTYTSACLVRFLGGLLNGTLTITKSALAELCDGSNQAKGFGILNLAWGIGSVTGPVVSGLLAQPCVQYKLPKCPTLLANYPFLLPCLGAAVFSVASIIASVSLTETNPRFVRISYDRLSAQAPGSTSVDLEELHAEEDDPNCSEMVQLTGGNMNQVVDQQASSTTGMSCRQKLILVISTTEQLERKQIVVREGGKSCYRKQENFASASEEEIQDNNNAVTRFEWVDRNVLLASLCYSMTGLIFIITDELFPMFGAASRSVGGLGFSSSALGLILGEGGVVLCLYTILLYPEVCRRLGPLRCFRLGILSTIPLWVFFPISSLIATVPVLQWSLLLLCMAARSVSACTTFTGVLILVSNSASPEHMGAVTGLSHSFCSFFRAVGPACGGVIWSFASGRQFPLHQFLAWQFVVFLSICTFGLSYLLPPSLSRPKLDNLRLMEPHLENS